MEVEVGVGVGWVVEVEVGGREGREEVGCWWEVERGSGGEGEEVGEEEEEGGDEGEHG